MEAYNILLINWKKSQKDFSQILTQLQQRINTAAIHDIRVTTKKLRAFLNLYMLIKKEPEWEYFLSKTENLFDVLGRHREVEICLELITTYEKESNCSLKELKNYLLSVLRMTRAWANQEIHRYHKKELARIALLLKQDVSINESPDFPNDLKLIINNLLSETKKHFRQPHLVRKNLKNVYYWIPLFSEENLQEPWHHKELHSILDDLGNWQDLEILEIRIRHFRKDYLPKLFKEYQAIKDLQANLKDDKKLLLKAAYSKARRWMKKVMKNVKSEE